MRLKSPWLQGLAGLTAAWAVRSWMNTLSYKGAFYDPTVDPVNPACQGQKIYLFWHEYILLPLALRGHSNLAMLLSQHRDAEILARAARHMGFETIRGSTNRGGVAALRELLRRSQRMNLAIVPDGPRGPRRVLAPGPVYLSSKLQLPIVLLGLGFDRPWRARSWDRFAVPRPGTRARGVVSPALQIPPDLDREGLEHYRQEVERMLTRLTCEAEAWAESGTRKLAECIVRREPAPLRSHRRVDAGHGPGRPTATASSRRLARFQ